MVKMNKKYKTYDSNAGLNIRNEASIYDMVLKEIRFSLWQLIVVTTASVRT